MSDTHWLLSEKYMLRLTAEAASWDLAGREDTVLISSRALFPHFLRSLYFFHGPYFPRSLSFYEALWFLMGANYLQLLVFLEV